MQADTVTNSADSGSGSLRGVLAAASDGETIDFVPALNGATITLTSGPLNITGRTLTIDASALPSGITISGNIDDDDENRFRIFTITGNSNVTLVNLHLVNGRESASSGGGIAALQSQLNMENCSVRACYSGGTGGGLYGNDITGNIARCKFQNNESGSVGGGIFIGVSSLHVSNSLVAGNKAVSGGGISNYTSSSVFANCSIQGNSGSGIQSQVSSNPMVRNCIVWGNGNLTAASQLENATDSHPDVDHSLIQGASGSISFGDGNAVNWGAGNLNGTLVSPAFVAMFDPANAPTSSGDLRVYSNSPVLNAGDNDFGGTSLDLAGNARIQDDIIDLGAYEGGYVSFPFLYPGLPPTGDANGNGYSNFLDYALGIDPVSPGVLPADRIYSTNDGSKFVTFTRRTNGIDVVLSRQTSASLAPASWQPMIQGTHYTIESTSGLFPAIEQVVWKLIPLGSERFYRQMFSQ